MEIAYRVNPPLRPEQVAELFHSSGIKRPIEDLGRIEQMIVHANLTISAWLGEQLVGIARSLTDFSYCCYLSDLAVRSEYQKKGIGRELIRRLREAVGDGVTILLLSSPIAMTYYPALGFTRAENAWYLPRRR